ncbi:MAG: hypothetical protein ACT452_21435 [Microthrixaceae bacterium]
MALFDALTRRSTRSTDDLPAQPSDDDLLAWAHELKLGRPRRVRQLVAEPLDNRSA